MEQISYSILALDHEVDGSFGLTNLEHQGLAPHHLHPSLEVSQSLAIPMAGLMAMAVLMPQQAKAIVRIGDNCPAVRDLQTALVSLDYNIGTIDGVFGPQTYTAVQDFQQKNNLEPDGVVGPTTARAMQLIKDGDNPGIYASDQTCTVARNTAGTSPSSPSGNASTPTPSSTTYTVTADALNVRSGPGTTYGILRTVSQGQEVTGTPDNSGWVKIADNEWVAASYLQASAPSTPTPATDEPVATNPSVGVDLASLQYGDLVQVTSPRINVRTGPGTDYAVIGIVLQDEVLPVTGISTADGWIQLGWGDWIAAQFVKPL